MGSLSKCRVRKKTYEEPLNVVREEFFSWMGWFVQSSLQGSDKSNSLHDTCNHTATVLNASLYIATTSAVKFLADNNSDSGNVPSSGVGQHTNVLNHVKQQQYASTSHLSSLRGG